ncbi:hypothetical protein B0T25DRAFT_440965, partial [Lasiosphaeria hispida]
FGNESGLLFSRIPLLIHESAHLFLFADIREWVSQMGLTRNAPSTGSSRYKGIGIRSKEGDSGILPRPPRWAKNHLPTLVIEAGNSELFRELHTKDWWFDNSPPGPNGNVRIAVLIKLERQTGHIFVEQW